MENVMTCKGCKNLDMSRSYTEDSFFQQFDWKCQKNDKMITSFVGVFDKDPKKPEWCLEQYIGI